MAGRTDIGLSTGLVIPANVKAIGGSIDEKGHNSNNKQTYTENHKNKG